MVGTKEQTKKLPRPLGRNEMEKEEFMVNSSPAQEKNDHD
jgi:hypothetical protein